MPLSAREKTLSASPKVILRGVFTTANRAAHALGQLEAVRQQRALQAIALQRFRDGASPTEIVAWLDALAESAKVDAARLADRDRDEARLHVCA